MNIQVVLLVRNLPANAGDTRDMGSIPGWVRSPGGGNGNSLQYSCLENSMNKGAWWATVCGVAKSQTRLSNYIYTYISTVYTVLLYFTSILYLM